MKKSFMIGLLQMRPEKQLICVPHKDYMHMQQLQDITTVQLLPLAKWCSFNFTAVTSKLGLEPTSQISDNGFGEGTDMKLWPIYERCRMHQQSWQLLHSRQGKLVTGNSKHWNKFGSSIHIDLFNLYPSFITYLSYSTAPCCWNADSQL